MRPELTYPAVLLAREAMATRFELVLPGTPTPSLRAAGEEALGEIARLEGLLSVYRPTSEIAHVNACAAREAVRVSPPVFAVLERARRWHELTGGAFDITIGPLLRCWGFMGAEGAMPEPAAVAAARAVTGMQWVELDAAEMTVRFRKPGVMVDLGGIGKGYALDCAIELLREAGVRDALLHGGTSSVYALGAPPDTGAWRLGIESHPLRAGGPKIPLAVVELRDQSLTVSTVWGKHFQREGRTYGHILDPRTGEPAEAAVVSAVRCASATDGDALATALIVDGRQRHGQLSRCVPGLQTLVAWEAPEGGRLQVAAHGLALLPDVAAEVVWQES
ncbi:MAG: FAD:protein FMN transferase [Verrucomicrobiae bacterium]|nr:FAD:protein FMN transferase [Verrucomicrobiae bacterium]